MKWKRISNDVRGCYFQASQLVQYSNDVVSSYLIRLYISRYHEKYDDRMNDDDTANVLCSMAVNFDDFFTRSLTSLDEHLILIVNFLLVSSDFLQFVQAYRAQDSISVENGYQTFAPIWKLLGQVKYLEATREQMENLYTLKGKICINVDISSAFFIIPIKEEHRHKTAFWVNDKSFEFNVAVMGLKSSPYHLKKFMELAFAPFNFTKGIERI